VLTGMLSGQVAILEDLRASESASRG